MKSFVYVLFLCFLFITSCKEKNSTSQKEESVPVEQKTTLNNWKPLFNGTDLDGWTMKITGHPLGENFGNTFRVSDGILSIRYDAYGDDFNNRFGALYFNEKLANYRLKVEYRFVGETAPGAPEWGFRDSGVQFHSQSPASLKEDQPFPVSLEYNLHGGNGTDERPVGQICANGIFVELNGQQNTSYCTPPSVKRTFHGDQWVTLEIDVKDGKISHFANGEEILSYSNPTYNPEHEVAKTLIVNGDTSVKDGYISLQSNSHPIDFRKIELLKY
ncbi:DUF1080 domain-containing protein [uncultured Eudoraea sp.]|jgi:hypothetical protein|uniref:3-keto-disaccharide hydrolase n=1 Tax=uncultured Eudoraea sp. TaxID=1035614 RepID=UPI00261D9321|nr:DUF1080 domain-containing protein [uncultured Eudoraea sp.]